jgi:hypothetical protein
MQDVKDILNFQDALNLENPLTGFLPKKVLCLEVRRCYSPNHHPIYAFWKA